MDSKIPSDDDFDQFLVDETERQNQANHFQELQVYADQLFDTEIQSRGIPHLTDEHGDVSMDKVIASTEDYISKNYDALLQEVLTVYPYLAEQQQSQMKIDEIIKMESLQIVTAQAIKQSGMLSRAKLITIQYLDRHRSGRSVEVPVRVKHQAIAGLLVHNGLDGNDPWITMLNETIPGKPFDPYSEDGISYMAEAMTKLVEIEEQQKFHDQIVAELSSVLQEYQPSETDTDDILDIKATIILEYVAATYRGQLISPSQRQANFDEVARKFGIGVDLSRRIVEYLNIQFPSVQADEVN